MTDMPPGPVAGVVTAAAKKLTQAMREEAKLHGAKSFNLVYSLGDTLSDFAPQMSSTALGAAGKSLSRADVVAYKEMENALERAVKSLPKPKRFRSVVFFWQVRDCRQPVQDVLLSLATVVPLISEAVRTFERYGILKERNTNSDLTIQALYEKTAKEVDKAINELVHSLVSLDENVDFAAAFLLAWRRGSGAVSKKEIAALRETSAKRAWTHFGWVGS